MVRRPSIASILAVALGAPPPPPVEPPALPADVAQALEAAEAMERGGAFAAAREQLTATLPLVDEALRPELSRRVCALWRAEGSLPQARRCFEDVAAGAGADAEQRALCRYHAGIIAAAQGDPDAPELLRAALLSDPDTAGAHRALVWLRAHRRHADGPGAEADALVGIASALTRAGHGPGSRLLAEALVEAGRLRTQLGQPERAVSILASARAAAADTVWHDDALIWSARAARDAGSWQQARAFYEELIAARERSFFVGTYDSLHLDDALLEVADLLASRGRTDEARAAYARLPELTPTSRLVDDAVFALARLDGTPEALRSFVAEHPNSRHVQVARRLLGEAPP